MIKVFVQLIIKFSLLISVLLFAFDAVSAEDSDVGNDNDSQKKKYNIATVQHQDMQLFFKAYEGFKNGLEELDFAKKVNVEYFNAKSDIAKLDEVCAQYSTRTDLDLIFAIGTRSTKKVMEYNTEIPIVFTGVTDPVNAGILTNWKSSGRNLTGIGTPRYITMGIKLLFENLENPTNLGMIYFKGSPSHEGGIQQVKEFSKKAGFKFVYKGFPLRDKDGNKKSPEVVRANLKECLEYVLPKVKLFFVQPSRSFVTNFDIFRDAFIKYQTFSAGEPKYIRKGIIMGIGRDINEFGRQSAEYAFKILNDGVSPSDLPMDTGEQFLIEFNLKAAELVDFAAPILLLAATDIIYKELEIKE